MSATQPARQKWIARGLLALLVVLGLGWMVRLNLAAKVSTNVLDLIPASERAPELAVARSLANEQQARVALFVLEGADGGALDRAAEAFAATLRRSPAFAEVRRMPDTAGREALGRHLFTHRLDLLLPDWLAARRGEHDRTAPTVPWPNWLADRVAADLDKFLATPEAIAFQDVIPADPLLLVPTLVEGLQGLGDGAPAGRALLWARTHAAPMSEAGQQAQLAAVDDARQQAQLTTPQVRVRWTSIARFAAENRTRIERELSWLNVASLVAVLLVAAVCLRRLRDTLELIPVLAGALLGAWVGVTLVFDRVHVLVFVVGSLLGGVAIDYGFYLFLQPPRFAGEPYVEKVRRLAKPLIASALTTIIGFSLLLWSELPLIRQLGVFVSFGLVSALIVAVLWFAQRDVTCAQTRDLVRFRPDPSRSRRVAQWALALIGVIAIAGPWATHWRDDIRQLETLPAGFREDAAAVRADFGETAERTVYVTRGATPAAARTALAEFAAWHRATFPGTSLASPGLILPVPRNLDMMADERAALAPFEPVLRAALDKRGFEPVGFEPFFAEWREWIHRAPSEFAVLERELRESLQGPLAMGMAVGDGEAWFISVASHPAGLPPPAALGTIPLDQLQTFNRLFSRYRQSALQLSAAGLGLLGLSVLLLYGIRRGAAIFAIPAGSCLFALGLLGVAGVTLNLFHLLGAFLGVCLSHNYAIFSAENRARGDEPPPSIRLSALTTAASFGVLAFSGIAVVAALGTTVALIVLCALAIVELGPLAATGLSR